MTKSIISIDAKCKRNGSYAMLRKYQNRTCTECLTSKLSDIWFYH